MHLFPASGNLKPSGDDELTRWNMAQVEGSALVAQAIQREGITTLFGLAGGPIQDIM